MKDLVEVKSVTILKGMSGEKFDTVILNVDLELNVSIIDKDSTIKLKVEKGKAEDYFTSLYKDKDVRIEIVGDSKDE